MCAPPVPPRAPPPDDSPSSSEKPPGSEAACPTPAKSLQKIVRINDCYHIYKLLIYRRIFVMK